VCFFGSGVFIAWVVVFGFGFFFKPRVFSQSSDFLDAVSLLQFYEV